MTHTLKQLGRHSLSVLAALTVVACSSEGDGGTEPGSIAITLSAASASVAQGGNTTVTATLTRAGSFSGTVALTVTGAPAGVTATVGAQTVVGNSITAVVTINVDAAVPAATYPLVVHGNGTGVAEALANFGLTVTALPAAYTLTLTAPTLSIVQGAATPTTTVNLGRTNFIGNVALTVENLPAGVTAAFAPASPISGNSSVLTLTVAPTAAVGTTNLLVRGVATGLADRTAPLALTITALPSSFALSLTQPALSIVQGASTPTTTVNIARTNFTGDVTLSVLNLPTGVTAAFAPVNPQSGNSSVLTLTVPLATPIGVYNTLAVQGVGSTGTLSTPLTLTVTAAPPVGNFTLTTTPATTASVTQGLNTNVTINVNRTGGNTSDIALTVTGTLPAGLTAVPTPPSTTGTSSTLAITASALVPVGAYPIVIHGNTTGLGEQLANLTINVVAPAGSGNVTVSFAGCAAADKAAWLAFMDGTAGTWTVVTGAADVYNFTINQTKGSIAWVTLGSGTSVINVQHMLRTELIAGTISFCSAPVAAGETLNGTLANLPGSQLATISFGGSFAFGFVNGPFQIMNARDGSFNLIAYSHIIGGAGGGDRAYIDPVLQNPTNGGAFANTVDFAHATNSFSPTPALVTVNGTNLGETQFHGMTFYSGTGPTACTPAPLYSGATFTGNTFTAYAIPVAKQPAGGMHQVSVTAANGTTAFRSLLENFVDLTARAATPLVLAPGLTAPAVVNAGGPYKRPQATVTGLPVDYNLQSSLIFSDQTVTGKSGAIGASAGWLGGSSFVLVLPDFSGLAGFLNAWAPATGDALQWTLASSGGTFTSACQAGARFVTGSRTGTL